MQTISKMQIERYFADMLDAKDVVRILAESVGKPTETAIEALIAQSVSHAQIEQSILADLANATGRRLASSTQSGVTSAAGTTVMLRSSGNTFLGSELI